MNYKWQPRPIPNLQQSACSSNFSTVLLITVIAVLISSQPVSPHALPPAPRRAEGSRASPGNSHRPASVSKGKEMTQAGKKSKSRKRHNSSWACTSLQPGPHTALSLPRPRARGPARSGWSGLPRRARALDSAAASSGCARRAARKEAAEGAPPAGTAPAGRGGQNPRPGRGAASREAGAGGLQPRPGGLSMPVRRRPRVLLPSARGGATRSSAGTGRGGGDTHPWWRWRRRRLGPECHLRSRGCMPGARAAGTAAGLAPRGGRGLCSGPPPPPQAPAPAPPAAGRCGMGRVARYIPGAPRLGPARLRRRHSTRPPASPLVPQSLRPATVLHLRNAPKNKPLVAQLSPLSVTHPSTGQSQAVAGPSYHPYSLHQPITSRKPLPPLSPQLANSQPPANHQHHTMNHSRLLS